MQKYNLFDGEAKEYDKWFYDNDKIFKTELEVIKAFIPKFGKGIEIGVGTGIFALNLGIKYGLEPSFKMSKKAIEKGIKVYNGVAEDIPLEKESYDFALMITVDCFLDNINKAFSEVNRILSSDGIFIIAFIDKATPLGQMYEENKNEHKVYKYATFHTSDEIISSLKFSGFEIIDKNQTIYTLENIEQEIKEGVGEGVFAVIKAKKIN